MKIMYRAIAFTLILTPSVASAEFKGIKGIISGVGDIIQTLTGIAAAAALLFFLWGLARFILAVGGDEKAVSQGKTFMMWGIIALFVMVSVTGIIAFMQSELGLPNAGGGAQIQGGSINPLGGSYPAPSSYYKGDEYQYPAPYDSELEPI
jgi:hypothetical protein